MSDSGRQIGDCRHGRNPEWCIDCLRAERDRLAVENAAYWRAANRIRNATTDEEEAAACEDLVRISMGNDWCHVPPELVERAVRQMAILTAERDRLQRDLDCALGVLSDNDLGIGDMVAMPLKKDVQIERLRAALAHYWNYQPCPCGARKDSPHTHPHVIGCPVGVALEGE